MYTKYNKGAQTDPCGTHILIIAKSDIPVLAILLSVKLFRNKNNAVPVIP